MILTIEVSDNRVGDLASCGIDRAATGYWAHVSHGERGTLFVMERETGERWQVNDERLRRGLEVMAKIAPHHFGDFLAGHEDATTGDVFLQCCTFGEVKYG